MASRARARRRRVALARRSFDELVAEAAAAPIDRWDFGWLEGRATEARPSWGYGRLVAARLATADRALDLQTGGAHVLLEAPALPRLLVASEGWSTARADVAPRLRARGAHLVGGDDRLPFVGSAFDLVLARHPVATPWDEIARVLVPGGTFLSQQVGHRSMEELGALFRGPRIGTARTTDAAVAAATAAGLEVVDLRTESLPAEFFDVGAVVWFLRLVVWIVPDFDVDRHRDALRTVHEQIERDGSFVAHSTRFLIEARKPA